MDDTRTKEPGWLERPSRSGTWRSGPLAGTTREAEGELMPISSYT